MGMGGGAGAASYAGMAAGGFSTITNMITQYIQDQKIGDAMKEIAEEKTRYANRLGKLGDNFELDVNPYEDFLFTLVNGNLDPAVATGTAGALAATGFPTGGVLNQGGPLQQTINMLGSMQLSQRDFDEAVKSLKKGKPNQFAKTAARNAGFGNIKKLRAEQKRWETQINKIRPQLDKQAADSMEGRLAALGSVSDIQQDFPVITRDNINQLEQRIREQRYGEIDRAADDEIESAMVAAQAQGINPAAILGRISESVTEQKGAVDSHDALARTLQLLGGEVDLGHNAMTALQASLARADSNLSNFAGLRSDNTNRMGSIAAQQAQAKNQILGEAVLQEAMTKLGINMDVLGLKHDANTTNLLGNLTRSLALSNAAQVGAEGTSQTFGAGVTRPDNSGNKNLVSNSATPSISNNSGLYDMRLNNGAGGFQTFNSTLNNTPGGQPSQTFFPTNFGGSITGNNAPAAGGGLGDLGSLLGGLGG